MVRAAAIDRFALAARAQRTLGLTQRQLANLIGVSYRTAQRMTRRRMRLYDDHLCKLARAVHPHDGELGAELAAAASTTLVELGLVPPPPAPAPVVVVEPPPPPRARPPASALIDSLVCAAADAHGVMPDAIRAALLAAFARGVELGLTMEEAAEALRAVLRPPTPGAEATRPARAIHVGTNAAADAKRPAPVAVEDKAEDATSPEPATRKARR